MASNKILWCTIVLAVSFTDALPRRDPGSYEVGNSGDSPGFRFGEEYFTPEVIQTVPEKQKKPDGCEKVIRDSMVCMVCRDPDTHAKYEQCSYVPHQSDKSYSYAGSDVQKPRNYETPQPKLREEAEPNSRKESLEEASGESEEAEESSPYSGYYGSESESKESEESSPSSPSRSYDEASGEYVPESERLAERADDESKCKEEKRDDGMTCQVCTDPKTGRNFEKCAYVYEPNDKAFKFSRSTSFGNPREKSKGKGKAPKKAIRRVDEKEQEKVEDKSPEKSQVSEKVSDDGCREVVRDSMTCSVCTDPKTGRKSEQCAYSYDPADKLFTYSQSRSFGSKDQPKKAAKVKKTKE